MLTSQVDLRIGNISSVFDWNSEALRQSRSIYFLLCKTYPCTLSILFACLIVYYSLISLLTLISDKIIKRKSLFFLNCFWIQEMTFIQKRIKAMFSHIFLFNKCQAAYQMEGSKFNLLWSVKWWHFLNLFGFISSSFSLFEVWDGCFLATAEMIQRMKSPQETCFQTFYYRSFEIIRKSSRHILFVTLLCPLELN